MTAQKRRDLTVGALVALVILLAVAARAVTRGHREEPYFLPVSLLRSFLYMGLMTAWAVSIGRRIVQTQVRRYLLAIALLCAFWLGIRTVKYFFAVSPAAVRYLWYGYYFPMLFLPLLAVFVSLSLGRPENYRLPRRVHLLYVPAAALFALVMTNDLHRLVFMAPAGTLEALDQHHGYGPAYFVLMVWIGLCIAAAIGTMLYKCRLPHSRLVLTLPFVPVGLALAYCLVYMLWKPDWLELLLGDLTVVQCLLLAATLESCIRCGLIQSNTGYAALFAASDLYAQITDRNLNIRETSVPHVSIPKEVLREAVDHTVVLDHNTLLKSSPISTGYVFWQEDVTELQQVLDALRLVREELVETGDILKEENAQKARRYQLAEKTRLYDLVEQESAPQFTRLEELLERLSRVRTPEAGKELLGRIAVVMTYIKRRSNLVFLAAQRDTMEADELRLCMNESAMALGLCGIVCTVQLSLPEEFPARTAISLYDLFGAVLDTGRSLSAMLFCVQQTGETLLARIGASCAESLENLPDRFPGLAVEHDEDGLWHLTWKIEVGK